MKLTLCICLYGIGDCEREEGSIRTVCVCVLGWVGIVASLGERTYIGGGEE